MQNFLKLIRDSKGATAIEYGLIAALIAVAAIAAMTSLGDSLGNTFNGVSTKLENNQVDN
ncbi:Flp family type IVb pilin [Stakelama saccharophila]|uniref:Flp family type IVb pilin n=1 Tax=Stakelama saccharophila TaxID=3075605 RepID=A0ABZ0B604_9SPHN|nr:Flp family type IVb pilin [Stakelama sp. W311]WNO52667.1 Flp family type IVb pilin [Stakelama sp. W311]